MYEIEVSFPLYRKYHNNKSFFKVLNDQEFEEIQILGKKCFVYKFRARILPDRYLIKDMIELEGGRWLEISPEEYNEVSQGCVKAYNIG
jgi:hypothetical protein